MIQKCDNSKSQEWKFALVWEIRVVLVLIWNAAHVQCIAKNQVMQNFQMKCKFYREIVDYSDTQSHVDFIFDYVCDKS